MARPVDIRQASGDELGITWEDGHESRYTWQFLRASCPCAWCNDLRIKGTSEYIAADVRPSMVSPVGRYALSFDFSDGHSTGIYSFEYLRRMCPCLECTGSEAGPSPNPLPEGEGFAGSSPSRLPGGEGPSGSGSG